MIILKQGVSGSLTMPKIYRTRSGMGIPRIRVISFGGESIGIVDVLFGEESLGLQSQ